MTIGNVCTRQCLGIKDNPMLIAEELCQEKSALLERNPLSEDTFHVYVDMVGDLFHAGHMNLIRQAKLNAMDRAGQRQIQVIVGLHSDEECEGYKRKPMTKLSERVAAAVQCCYVDAVFFPAPLIITNEVMDNLNINLVVHGDDFDHEKTIKYYKVPMERGAFATAPYTPGISTSDLIKRIQSRPAA